jgi:integrase/recombinase XerD
MARIKLGKTGDSRTRAKARTPALREEVLELNQSLGNDAPLIDYLIAKGYSSRTTARYIDDTARMKRWAAKENIPITAMSYADVLHYVQSYAGRVSQRTKSIMINSIKHYFNYLVATEQITENPAMLIVIKGVHRKRLHHILTKQELESLYRNYSVQLDEKDKNRNWYRKSELNEKRDKIIVGLIVYQGLNSTELQRLEVNDLKLREGKIYIPGTRRSNERELELQSLQILDLMEYTLKTRDELLAIKSKQSDNLLVSGGASHSIQNALQRLTKKLQGQDGCKIQNLQQIRASVITHWLKIYNLRQVQYRAGHRFVSSTEAYMVNDLEGLLEDINKFHPIV